MDLRYRNFILNASPRFIFCYVPKVACTNWKSVLRRLAGHADYLNNSLAHSRDKGGLHYLSLQGAEAALLLDDSVPKYAMVRNPYSRALSAYLNKIESRLKGPRSEGDIFATAVAEIDAYRQASLDPFYHSQVDFEVFLRWLKASPSPWAANEHWALQSTILGLPGLRYKLVGRFEHMERDAPRLLSAMGCDIPLPTQTEVRFPPTNADRKLANYFTPACVALVKEIYANDFRLLGYPSDLPPQRQQGPAG